MIFRCSKMTDSYLKSGSGDWPLYTRTCQTVWFLILASTCTFSSSHIHFLTLQTVTCQQAKIINRPRVQKNVNKRRNLMRWRSLNNIDRTKESRPAIPAMTTKTQKLTKMDFPQRFFVLRICDPRTTQHTRDLPNLSYDCDL